MNEKIIMFLNRTNITKNHEKKYQNRTGYEKSTSQAVKSARYF